MNITRQKAFLTGSTGTHVLDNVKVKSDLNEENETYGNYNNSFKGGMSGNVLIKQPDYSNKDNIFHNNVGDRVLYEQVVDNKIFIDSTIRDYSRMPDPFMFIIKFNGIEPTTNNISISIDNHQYSYQKYIEGDTNIVIDRIFKNIKLITINTLMMPNYLEYKTTEDGSYDNIGRRLPKTSNKYLILKINELNNGRFFSNNKSFGKESFIMKMNDDVCVFLNRWIPFSDTVYYNNSQMRTLDKLTVEICDDKGKRLCPLLDGKKHDFFEEYRNLIDRFIYLQNKNTNESNKEIINLLPKLKSLKHITEHLSPELYLTIATLEPQINTLPQYRY